MNKNNEINQNDLKKAFESPNEVSQPEQTEQNQLSEEATKPKSYKGLTVALSLLCILATVAASVFGFLYFTNNSPSNENTNNQANITEPTESTDEEVAITDTYVLRDLDEKIAVLLGGKLNDRQITVGRSIYTDDIVLIQNGILPESRYLYKAISKADNVYLNNEQVSTIIEASGYPDYFRQELSQGVKGDSVAKVYKYYFGNEVQHQELTDTCPGYHYYPEIDIYAPDLIGGCGGATPYGRYYYIYDYKKNNSNAYAYIAAASSDPNDDFGNLKIYCNVYDYETLKQEENISICIENYPTSDGTFTLDSSNYQNFAKYRFVFNKADDGTYYFSHVEKLED